MDEKSTDEDGGENAKVWSTQMGTQAAIFSGFSKHVRKSIKCLIGDRSYLVLKKMQKAML